MREMGLSKVTEISGASVAVVLPGIGDCAVTIGVGVLAHAVVVTFTLSGLSSGLEPLSVSTR